jgi:hypothetical protein
MGIDDLRQQQAKQGARDEEEYHLKIDWNNLLRQFRNKAITEIIDGIASSDRLKGLQLKIELRDEDRSGELQFAHISVVGARIDFTFSVIVSPSLRLDKGQICMSFSREYRSADDSYKCELVVRTMGIPVAVYVSTPPRYLRGKGTSLGDYGNWTEGESRFLWRNDESTHQIITFVIQCLEGSFEQSQWV